MYITKSTPNIERDGTIKHGIEIKSGVLWIDGKIKYEAKKWYRLGDDRKWYFLGYGANPAFETTDEGIMNRELFNNVFEEYKQEV